ncbi:MAG: hypothetical protein KY394_06855, partial [Actinobacteria bacterium]|nr:hypothetical protein [Actinomycetota bacterium]
MRRAFDVLSSRVAQIALMVLLAGAAIVLADAEGGRQIADDAAVQRAAETVQSAAAVTDAAMQQAVVVARAWEEGVAERAEVEAAESSLRRRLAELEARIETLASLSGQPVAVRSTHLAYQEEVERVADNLTLGSISVIWQ